MQTRNRQIALFVAVMGLASSAWAADFVFSGAPGSDWNTVGNWTYWDGNVNGMVPALALPGSSDNAMINGSSSATSSAPITIGQFTIGRDAGNVSSWHITGGTVTVTGIGYVSDHGNGTLYMDGGELDVASDLRVSLAGSAGGKIVVNSGIINVAGTLAIPAVQYYDSTRVASVDLFGGTINTSGFSLKAWDNTMGHMNITQGTLHITQGPGAGSWRTGELAGWVTSGNLTAYGNASLDPAQNHIVITSDDNNIWVSAVPVPEPVSLSLLATGGLLLLRRRRRE